MEQDIVNTYPTPARSRAARIFGHVDNRRRYVRFGGDADTGTDKNYDG